MSPTRPWGAEFVLLAALWGASFLFMRIGATEFGALPTAFVRSALATLCLLPWLAARGRLPLLRAHAAPLLCAGLLNAGLPFALYAHALLSINTGLSAILNATTPLFGALVAWAWLNERLDRWRAAGLVLGFVGVALLAADEAGVRPGASSAAAALAIAACLGATLCYGLAASFSRKHLGGVDALATACGSLLGATLVLALPAALTWPAQTPSLRAWAAMAALALLCTGLAYVLFFRLIESAGAARALTVTYLIPVFALGYGAALLDETLTPWMLACAALILLGTALASGLANSVRLRP